MVVGANNDMKKADSEVLSLLKSCVSLQDVSDLLHDLRKPLMPIQNFAEIIQETGFALKNGETVSSEEIIKYSAIIMKAARYLDFMTQDFAEMAESAEGKNKLKISQTHLNDVVDEVSEYVGINNASSSSKKFVNIIKTHLPSENYGKEHDLIYTDKTKLMRLFYNLAANANDFTKDKIELGIKMLYTSEGILYQGFVKDNGLGISEEIQQKLKQEDYLLKENPDRITSKGIGLKISRDLSRLLGGNLSFESTPSVGTNFYFTFKNLKEEYLQSYK